MVVERLVAAAPVPAPVRRAVDLEIVLPARNEELRLPRTLTETIEHLAASPWKAAIVVVDSGSEDRTVDVVRGFAGAEVPVHLVRCARPGKGRALRQGFLTGNARYAGFMDADLATPLQTLNAVMPLLESGADAVIASRYRPGGRFVVPQSRLRRAGAGAFRAGARHVLPAVTDPQCGFKFFAGPVVRAAAARCRITGFAFDLELLGRMSQQGSRIVELPVAWTDVAGSSFRPLRHGAQAFVDLLRIRRMMRAGAPSRCAAAAADEQAATA